MKKIIIGGCSFTDSNMPKRALPDSMDFKMWPEVLGEFTDYEIINTARCGAGNRKILSDVTKEILKYESKDIAYVIIAWSEWTRQDILADNDVFTDSPWRTVVPKIDDERDKLVKESQHNNQHNEEFVNELYKTIQAKFPKNKDIINDNLQMMFYLQNLCESLHIDFRQFQMLDPLPWWRKKELFDNFDDPKGNYYQQTVEEKRTFLNHEIKTRTLLLMNNPIITLLDESKFIGFPIFNNIGGHTILDLLIKRFGYYSYRINDIDVHPNAESQRFIAKVVLKTLDL